MFSFFDTILSSSFGLPLQHNAKDLHVGTRRNHRGCFMQILSNVLAVSKDVGWANLGKLTDWNARTPLNPGYAAKCAIV